MRKFVVLGGAGTIGKIVVRDLFESHPDNRILIADYNFEKAKTLAESLKDSRVKAEFADARNVDKLTCLLRGNTVVINCLQHDFNLVVMGAALTADVHYIDLGGLFTWTQMQLRLNAKFRSAGLTAIIGMGCSPGITNVLTAYAASHLEKIRSIKIRVGAKDLGPPKNEEFRLPYSAQTIIEELTLKPWIFRDGKFLQISPRTGWELTEFPEPAGKIWTVRARHSEIATLPLSFKKKGIRYCDFKVSFEREFVNELMRRLKAGWTIKQFNELVGTPAKARPSPAADGLGWARPSRAKARPSPAADGLGWARPSRAQPNDCEISRVIVDNLAVDCHAVSKPQWQASAGDIDTGCPPSIIAQMIAEGLIEKRGVLPPEIAVPIQPFFAELEKRGMKITKAS